LDIIIYAFYNNKGGVGKTTLCFNAATLYAKQNPDTQILIIDMCPQANISQLLLGGGKKGYDTNQKIQSSATRRNIVGFIDWINRGNSKFKTLNQSYKTRVSHHNRYVSDNLYLIAGDLFLESFSLALNYSVLNPANLYAWREYMTAIKKLCELEFDKERYKKMIVFIDCNPSFSIYTQMALVSSDRIVIPMVADFSSLEGIKGLFMLLFEKYPSAALRNYADGIITFKRQVDQFHLELPVIWEFVFNNYTSNQGVAKAYKSLRMELIEFCYQQFVKFRDLFANSNFEINNQDDWEKLFISDIKDFHSAGRVSSSLGIPLFRLPEMSKYTMPDDETQVILSEKSYEESLSNIIQFTSKIEY